MSVHALQHAEDLHPANDMFNALPGMRQHAVFLALVGGEGRRTRRLVGRDGVPVASPQALIPGIADKRRVVRKTHARLTEQLQVMNGPRACGSAQDVLRHGADQQLKFQGMPLLLAAVPAALFFLGRSHGTSEASTATTL